MEWPATCNLKVKQRPTGSPLLLCTYCWELCKHAFWEHSGFLCLFPVLHCATMWEMTVNMEQGQIPMSQRPSDLPFNPYETKDQNTSHTVRLKCSWAPLVHTDFYLNCPPACEAALQKRVEYVYMYVSVSYFLV